MTLIYISSARSRDTQITQSATPTSIWKRALGDLGVGFGHSGEEVKEISFEWERVRSSLEAQRWQAVSGEVTDID